MQPKILAISILALLSPAQAGTKRLPVLNKPVTDVSTIPTTPIQINLNQAFGTEAIDDQVVRFTSWYSMSGSPVVLDFALFSNRTPATRNNFLKYVADGDYINSFIHRSSPAFVIQGGGFRFDANSNLESVPVDPPVVNEFGVSNTLGTISMAKQGGNPNSATSQWFVSLGANSNNLDNQNGGFTVFGRVTKSTFSNAQLFGNQTEFPIWNAGGALNELPLLKTFTNSVGQAWPAFSICFTDVALAPLPAGQAGESTTLTYSIFSNSNPALATTAINAGNLTVTPVSGQTGTTTLTIRATDSVGNTVDDTFIVTVNTSDTYTTWASRTAFTYNQNGISQNPDGDAFNNLMEYALMGNPSVSNQAQTPTQGSTGTGASKILTLTFPVRKFTTGLTYTVESNTGLGGTWTTVWNSANGFSHAQVVSAVSQPDRTQVTIKDTVPMGSQSRRFMRVKVVQN